MTTKQMLAIRWVVGDVSPHGFEALQLSIWGAWKLFRSAATYSVCVNTISLGEAQSRTGELPEAVRWRDVTGALPDFLKSYFGREMAEGAGWKLAPPRLYPDRFELVLDNDCILWEKPAALHSWFRDRGRPRYVIAEDVRPCFGQFRDVCGPEPRNSGLRGFPPGFDFEAAIRRVLRNRSGVFNSELDEQGLQVAAISQAGDPLIVKLEEVTICSPFSPHLPHLGHCGAHFVGLNARQLPWQFQNRPAVDYIRELWQHYRQELQERVGLEGPAPSPIAITKSSKRQIP